MIDINLKNKIIIDYLNNPSIDALSKKYKIDASTIKRWTNKYKKKKNINIYLLDEENIPLSKFLSIISISENDFLYVFTSKNIEETKHIRKILAPVRPFKNSLDYRLIVGLGEILEEHKSVIKNEITSLNIVSNDNLFLSIINSIEYPVNVLKFITEPAFPNSYRLAYYLQSKSIHTTKVTSSSNSIAVSKKNIKKYLLKNSVKSLPTSPSVDFSEVYPILNTFSSNIQNKLLLLLEQDLKNNSTKLNDEICRIIVKASTTPQLGTKTFSKLAKEFKKLKKKS